MQRSARTRVALQGVIACVVTAPQQPIFQQDFALDTYNAGVPLHLTRHPALNKAWLL